MNNNNMRSSFLNGPPKPTIMSPLFSFLKKPRQAFVSNPNISFPENSGNKESWAASTKNWDAELNSFENSGPYHNYTNTSMPLRTGSPNFQKSNEKNKNGMKADYLLGPPYPKGAYNKGNGSTISGPSNSRYASVPTVYNFDEDLIMDFQESKDDASLPLIKRPKSRAMRVITATPSKLRKWKTSDIEDVILFELFGILSSPVNTAKNGIAKYFLLKSGNDTISCVFHEIDKKMPPLKRGEWQRAVGSYDVNGTFRCITIRLASEYEIQILDEYIQKIEKTMPSLLRECD